MKVTRAHIKQFALGVICILSVTSCTVNEHYTRCPHKHYNRKEVVVVKPANSCSNITPPWTPQMNKY